MKTPRDLLLERHRQIESKLDALRQQTVANLQARSADGQNSEIKSGLRFSGLRALLMPLRWHVAGLAAAWLVIAGMSVEPPLLVHLFTINTSSMQARSQPVTTSRPLMTGLRENRQRLFELMGQTDPEQLPNDHPAAPPRRSELVSRTATA